MGDDAIKSGGFRKRRGVMDNIFVINYLANRQISKKGGKMIALFVDLRAAFDPVNREVLVKALRKTRVKEGKRGICGIEEFLRETKSSVRAGGETGDCFWTARGVRQGCPLSPLLFNVVIAGEEVLWRVRWGGG